jgi:hypothetical protein
MPRLATIAATAALLGLNTMGPLDDDVRCNYTRRTVCEGTNCKAIPFGSSYLLSPPLTALEDADLPAEGQAPELEIRRCDSDGCTPVSVVVRWDGAFLDISGPSNGYMAKIYHYRPNELSSYRTGDFVEIATVGLLVEISYGHCPFEAPQ